MHRRRLRRTGLGRERHHDRRIYRERLFQPRVGAQDGQAFRPEYRLFVPLRARHRPQHAGLRRQARRPADEGAGRGYDLQRHHGHLSGADRGFRLRHLVGKGQRADRQGDSRNGRPHDHRGAGGEDPRRERRRADGRRAALPCRRAARSRPRGGHPAHLRLQQRRNPHAGPFDALLCAETRPQPSDEPRGRFPHGQRVYRDHVQLADESRLLRGPDLLPRRALRAHSQPVERRPERDAPDADVQHAGGRRSERQPPQRRSLPLRVRQLLFLRRVEAHGRKPPSGLLRGVPPRHRRHGRLDAAVVECEAREGVVLHPARSRRETAPPLRHRHLRAEGRDARKRSFQRGPHAVAQWQTVVADRLRGRRNPPPYRCQAGCVLSGDEFRGPCEIHEEAEDCRRGTVEIPRGQTRSGAAGGQVRDLLLAARRSLRRRAQAAEKRLAVRCLRGR